MLFYLKRVNKKEKQPCVSCRKSEEWCDKHGENKQPSLFNHLLFPRDGPSHLTKRLAEPMLCPAETPAVLSPRSSTHTTHSSQLIMPAVKSLVNKKTRNIVLVFLFLKKIITTPSCLLFCIP